MRTGQLDLLDPPAVAPPDPPVVRRRKRGSVRSTSIAQYAHGREMFKGRKADALRWLAAFRNARQFNPTSAELAQWATNPAPDGSVTIWPSWDAKLLYVRRGLSDLLAAGVAQAVPNGKRNCQVTQHVCETWRVIPVGR